MDLLKFLEDNNIEFKLNEQLKNHTNFKIGGQCRVMCFPKKIPTLVRLLKFLTTQKIDFYILGNGTNMLVSDSGYNGVVVKLGGMLTGYKIDNSSVFAEAGVNLFKLNKLLAEFSLKGLEFSYGIPGSVGGAVAMNAGAYGKSVGDYIMSVKVFDGEKIRTIKKRDLNFSYRHSTILEKNYVVLGATFLLEKSSKVEIENLQQQYFTKRLESQPYNKRCAGSIFKRLENGKKPVSKMIDELGLKGKKSGDAEISTLHAGFIVNNGQATCKDVLFLIKYIQQKIKSSYDENAQLEIKLLGDMDDFKR